jgi:hypothetical protein
MGKFRIPRYLKVLGLVLLMLAIVVFIIGLIILIGYGLYSVFGFIGILVLFISIPILGLLYEVANDIIP